MRELVSMWRETRLVLLVAVFGAVLVVGSLALRLQGYGTV